MSQAEFAIYVGNGMYMDSNGQLSKKAPDDKAVYKAAGGGLPVNLDDVEKALEGVAKWLPNDNSSNSKKWQKLGLPDDAMQFLRKAGEIAGSIASVIPYVGAAVAVAKWLGILGGSDGETSIVDRRFNELASLFIQHDQQAAHIFIGQQRAAIVEATNTVAKYNTELLYFAKKDPAANLLQLQLARQAMVASLASATQALRYLLIRAQWETVYDQNDYSPGFDWGWSAPTLKTFAPDGSAVPVSLPGNLRLRFDHRLMAPMAAWAVHAWLTLIKAIVPEFRTSGDFEQDLLKGMDPLADLLEQRVADMRNSVLARMVYEPSHFSQPLAEQEVLHSGLPFFGQPSVAIGPNFPGFTVGAIDTVQYTKSFFAITKSTPGNSDPAHPARWASIDTRWIPPATLAAEQELGTNRTVYRITNPDVCAAAANAQSEADYADLMASSGYMTLMHLTALLRHVATKPDRSETVTGALSLGHQAGTTTNVTVESKSIFMSGVITSPARRETRKTRARVLLTTQPLGRQRAVEYRIKLRTLPSRPLSLEPMPYSAYYSTRYIADAQHPGFQKLQISALKGAEVGEKLLASGTSDEHTPATQAEGDLTIAADTFAWFIPVKPVTGIDAPLSEYINAGALSLATAAAQGSAQPPAAGTGGTTPAAGSAALKVSSLVSQAGALDVSLNDMLYWQAADEDIEGQRRDRQHNPAVKIHYKLEWIGNALSVTLDSNPADRNYVIYLVVEERVYHPGEEPDEEARYLHTSYAIPVNGELTFVPEEFFAKERAAIDRANKILHDIAMHYAESVPPRVGDPVSKYLRAADAMTRYDQRQLLAALQRQAPQLLQSVLQEHGLSEQDVRRALERAASDDAAAGPAGSAVAD